MLLYIYMFVLHVGFITNNAIIINNDCDEENMESWTLFA